jgi:hypothetical protein
MKQQLAALVMSLGIQGCSSIPSASGMPATSLPRPAYELMDLACSAVAVAMVVDGKGFDVNRCFVKELGVWAIDATATGVHSLAKSLTETPAPTPEPSVAEPKNQ